MTIPKDLEQAYSSCPSNFSQFVPEGRYRARAESLQLINSRSGSSGIEVGMRINAGPAEGKRIETVLWLVGGAMPRSKGSLESLGFKGLSLEDALAFTEFTQLPEVWAHVAHEVSAGQPRQSVTILPTGFGVSTKQGEDGA